MEWRRYGDNFFEDIPEEDLSSLAEEWRENMIESAAEANEELMDKYLEEGELSQDDIKEGLRIRTLANEIRYLSLWICF